MSPEQDPLTWHMVYGRCAIALLASFVGGHLSSLWLKIEFEFECHNLRLSQSSLPSRSSSTCNNNKRNIIIHDISYTIYTIYIQWYIYNVISCQLASSSSSFHCVRLLQFQREVKIQIISVWVTFLLDLLPPTPPCCNSGNASISFKYFLISFRPRLASTFSMGRSHCESSRGDIDDGLMANWVFCWLACTWRLPEKLG